MTKDLGILAKAIGDPNRLRILRSLLQCPLCVCEVGDSLAMAQSTLSTHLQVLRESGLVEDDRSGKWVVYRMSEGWMDVLRPLLGALPSEGRNLVRRDSIRLMRRLEMRRGGCCVVGFGGLDKHLKEVNAMSDVKACNCGCCTCDPCKCDPCECCTCGK